jgi:hypothetical protein
LIGGYLSRISNREVQRHQQNVTLNGLMRMSEGERLPEAELRGLRERAPSFVARARLGYVVVDRIHTPPFLRQFAIDAYHLTRIDQSGDYELYVPGNFR